MLSEAAEDFAGVQGVHAMKSADTNAKTFVP